MNTSRSTGMSFAFNIMFKLVSTPISELFQGTINRAFGASSLPMTDMPESSLASVGFASCYCCAAFALSSADGLLSLATAVPTSARNRHSQSNTFRYIFPPFFSPNARTACAAGNSYFDHLKLIPPLHQTEYPCRLCPVRHASVLRPLPLLWSLPASHPAQAVPSSLLLWPLLASLPASAVPSSPLL